MRTLYPTIEPYREHRLAVDAVHTDRSKDERAALAAFLRFAAEHKEIYRIIDEAEFVDQAAYRAHYENTATRMAARLKKAAQQGDVRADVEEVHAWAIMGMNVFLGLRYGVWDDSRPAQEIADIANALIEKGIGKRA